MTRSTFTRHDGPHAVYVPDMPRPVKLAIARMQRLGDFPRDPVAWADRRTSMCDARTALTLTLGGLPDPCTGNERGKQ